MSEPPSRAICEDILRRSAGLKGWYVDGFEGSKRPPGIAERSGAASAIALACSSAFLRMRILLKIFGWLFGSLEVMRRVRGLGGFLAARFEPPRVAPLPLVEEAPLVDGRPRVLADCPSFGTSFDGVIDFAAIDGSSGTKDTCWRV
jgi:hypothetical protein